MSTFAKYKQDSECFSSLEDRDDWLMTFTRNRDSDLLAESNWDAALKILGGESDTVEIVRFDHWTCGWVDYVLVHPSRSAEVDAINARLSDYPALDEDDFSTRESDAAYESWAEYGCREFAEAMQNEFDLMDSTRDLLTKSPDWTHHVFANSEPYALDMEGDTIRVRAYGGQTQITRDQMAKALRQIRREIAKGAGA